MQICIPGPIPEGLTIFETMRAEPDGRIALWHYHLSRLRDGCAAVGFPLNIDLVERVMMTLPRGTVLRARLSVDAAGQVALTHAPLPENPPSWRVAMSDLRLQRDDPWMTVKSSHRPVYDAARTAMPDDVDEALLMNIQGELCEGTITNIFLRHGDRLLTPPRTSGLLPGVLRQKMLADGRAIEAVLRPDDLRSTAFYCGNALRGLIPARLILD